MSVESGWEWWWTRQEDWAYILDVTGHQRVTARVFELAARFSCNRIHASGGWVQEEVQPRKCDGSNTRRGNDSAQQWRRWRLEPGDGGATAVGLGRRHEESA